MQKMFRQFISAHLHVALYHNTDIPFFIFRTVAQITVYYSDCSVFQSDVTSCEADSLIVGQEIPRLS
jgi:hypothetical protein